jgi:hypothetical protein
MENQMKMLDELPYATRQMRRLFEVLLVRVPG